jgi:aminocarboxymuconate-semialdehyde decarboxylase
MHSHIIPKEPTRLAWYKFGYGDFIYLKHNEDKTADMMQGGRFFRRIEENCWDEDFRINGICKISPQLFK